MNGLIVRALLQYYSYYGNEFTIECPTGSGRRMRRRPVYGETDKFQTDPHWRDYIQFFEYFHGDNGAGRGASHQTGWTGCIARLMHLFATVRPEQVLRAP